jgi:outer membrane protein assembly factor BamE (lipoprotein component of BamABCDE complex)
MPTATRRFTLLALAAAALALPGCAVISSENHTSYSGNYVPNDSLGQVRLGESTPEYTEALLGAPTNKADLEDGTSIWRWDYTVRKSGEGSLLLVFDGESSTEKKHSTFVQFQDGVAAKKWRN